MTRTEANKKTLRSASRNAEQAVNAVTTNECALVPMEEKVAWAMAAVVHCDMCRLIVAFDECEREGIARLLWMADIVSKLYEAKRWYLQKGSRRLRNIAKRKKCGPDCVGNKLKKIRSKFPITEIDKYAKYRNKLGFHYDDKAIDCLNEFGEENAESFFHLLKTFAHFSGEWAQLTKSLIKNELS